MSKPVLDKVISKMVFVEYNSGLFQMKKFFIESFQNIQPQPDLTKHLKAHINSLNTLSPNVVKEFEAIAKSDSEKAKTYLKKLSTGVDNLFEDLEFYLEAYTSKENKPWALRERLRRYEQLLFILHESVGDSVELFRNSIEKIHLENVPRIIRKRLNGVFAL